MHKLEEGKLVPLRCKERRRPGKQWRLPVSLWLWEIGFTVDPSADYIDYALLLVVK
jgi:hypothetical protein